MVQFQQYYFFHPVHLLVFVVFSKLIFFAVIYVLMHLMQKPKKNSGQYDKSVFLFIFIPLTSIFIMFIFISIGESIPLSSSLDWMIAVGAVFLLAANLLVFGINQYNQKKIWNLQKCSYCSNKNLIQPSIMKCCVYRTKTSAS